MRTTIYSSIEKLANQRMLRFVGVGLLNTAFGYSVYAFLVFAGIPYLIALSIATVAGVIFNYFSFGRMVFRAPGGSVVFVKFIAAYAVLYLANAALLRVLTTSFHFGPYLGQIICIPLSVLASWLLMNYWVYKRN
jgi:putative flippase GtrA